MIKRSTPSQAGEDATPQFRENPQVNAKIDAYIHNNPEDWKRIQAMPPERMARALVLAEIRNIERREKMNQGILSKLDENPELKERIEAMVKHLPEDQREKMKVSFASQLMRAERPKQKPSSGVKV